MDMSHFNLRRQLERLLHLHDSPKRTSVAFALGIFFGFSPFIGAHTILALTVAFIFRLNRVAALIGVYVNSPWTLVPVAIASTSLGELIMGRMGLSYEKFDWYELGSFRFWLHLPREIHEHYHTLYPFFVGSMTIAITLGLLAYPLCLWLIQTYRRKFLRRHD
jgi:uncharacterized protein (DUF2062 family)